MSVDHQQNLDHTDDKLIYFFYDLSAWSNGRSLDQKIKVFVVPGSNVKLIQTGPAYSVF